ncbi:hypothetical protein QE418_003438 [Microbacterium testaceum]|uniref:hypothetical protein n=1 Tax=Microbacterium TaxID=33882 RepID=UPI002784A9F6|nr:MULTISPECIES: hypothetical protein [Microbacterium]MDQ1113990.1 hypothetical protein [Microbacterium testaceum]MDR6098903.1 hypothetical protein [Microbacterium sp. SORGH_AS_0454]
MTELEAAREVALQKLESALHSMPPRSHAHTEIDVQVPIGALRTLIAATLLPTVSVRDRRCARCGGRLKPWGADWMHTDHADWKTRPHHPVADPPADDAREAVRNLIEPAVWAWFNEHDSPWSPSDQTMLTLSAPLADTIVSAVERGARS